jgi:hypothetical protein
MSVEVLNLDRIEAEKNSRKERTAQLRQAFADIYALVVNTGTHSKAEAVTSLVQKLVDQNIHLQSNRVILQPSKKEEPMRPKASEVALFKAETAKEEFLMNKFPELQFWLQQFDLAIRQDLSDQAVKELLANVVFYGGDINAFTIGPKTGLYVPSHKLERIFPESLPEEEYEKVRQKLYLNYVNPPSGVIEVVWNATNAIINGRTHVFSDLIEVRAKPLPKELVDKYIDAAVADGMILRSNTHLKAFEMLCESGCIITTSKLPRELARKGYTLVDFRQEPKEEELKAIYKTINNNEPIYVA